jgi:hypothetical protein
MAGTAVMFFARRNISFVNFPGFAGSQNAFDEILTDRATLSRMLAPNRRDPSAGCSPSSNNPILQKDVPIWGSRRADSSSRPTFMGLEWRVIGLAVGARRKC